MQSFQKLNARMLVTLFSMMLIFSSSIIADESMDKAMEAWQAKNYQEALEIWLLKAYDGNAEAQYRLGEMFASGRGTVVDKTEAVYWYTRATEQGHAAAQYQLGNAYFNGVGVKPDKAKALEWWHIGAENGNSEAQYHLGRAYFYGIDVQQDSDIALAWFDRSAKSGYQQSLDFLARVGSADQQQDVDNEWTGYGRVSDKTIRVYSSFNRLSPILTTLKSGALLRVVEHNAGWFRAQFPGGLPVWVPSEKIVVVNGQARINGSGVQARPDPGVNAEVKSVGIFLDADPVLILESREDWSKVQSPESMTGWVEAINIVELPEDQPVAKEWQATRDQFKELQVETRIQVVLNATDSSVSAQEEVIVQDTRSSLVDNAVDDQHTEVEETIESSDEELTQDHNEQPGIASDDPRFNNPVDIASISNNDILRIGPQGAEIFARNRSNSALIDRIPGAILVKVTEIKNNWLKVEVAGGLPLWIYSRFLDRNGNEGRIIGRGVRARPLPSTTNDSQPVGNYPTGVSVQILEELQEWVRIRAPQSIGGWIQANDIYLTSNDIVSIDEEWQKQVVNGPQTLQDLQVVEQAPTTEEPHVEKQESNINVVLDTPVVDEPVIDTVSRDDNSEAQLEDVANIEGESSKTENELAQDDGVDDTSENSEVDTVEPNLEEEVAANNSSTNIVGDVSTKPAEDTTQIDENLQTSTENVETDDSQPAVEATLTTDEIESDQKSLSTEGVESINEDTDASVTETVDLASETLIASEDSNPIDDESELSENSDLAIDVDQSVNDLAGNDSALSDQAVQPIEETLQRAEDVVDNIDQSVSDEVVKLPGQEKTQGNDSEVVNHLDDEADLSSDESEIQLTENVPEQIDQTDVVSQIDDSQPSETPLVSSPVIIDSLEWLFSQQKSSFTIELMKDSNLKEINASIADIVTEHQFVAFSSDSKSGQVFNLMVGAFDDLRPIQQVLPLFQSQFEDIRIRRLGSYQEEQCEQVDNLTPEQLLIIVDNCLN